MKNLYLVGAGGHCKSCIDVIEATGAYEIKGVFDHAKQVGEEILGYRILGDDSCIEKYIAHENYFLITIGQIKSAEPRLKIYKYLSSLNAQMATIISPKAYVSKHADIGAGTIVMHFSFVNAGVVIGENCIINTHSLIEHDAKIGKHSHVATSAVVNGDCVIGDESFIGSNATLKEGIHLLNNSLIPAGSFYRGK